MIQIAIVPPSNTVLTDTAGMYSRIHNALKLIRNDFIGYASEASPVGVYGALQGGWEEGITTITATEATTSVVNTQPYAYYVVKGTKPARGNPGGFIVPWVVKELTIGEQYRIARYAGMSEPAARNALTRSSVKFQYSALTVAVAFIIGRKRMREGYKGKDFITPIIREHSPFWRDIFADAITGRSS